MVGFLIYAFLVLIKLIYICLIFITTTVDSEFHLSSLQKTSIFFKCYLCQKELNFRLNVSHILTSPWPLLPSRKKQRRNTEIKFKRAASQAKCLVIKHRTCKKPKLKIYNANEYLIFNYVFTWQLLLMREEQSVTLTNDCRIKSSLPVAKRKATTSIL